jgi:small GTP-binding protein
MTIDNNADEIKPHYILKICILGQGGVGKTCICRRLCYNTFDANTQLTIGVDFYTYDLPILIGGKKKFIRLSLWDFGGQEQFRKFFLYYLSGANGIMLVFSIVNIQTLLMLDWWYERLIHHNHQNTPRFIIGTKTDLINTPDASTLIDDLVIDRFLKRHNETSFIKTSSKANHNIEYSFKQLVKRVLDHYNFHYDEII